MDPRESVIREAAEAVAADFAASSRSRRIPSPQKSSAAKKDSDVARCGGCRCCQGIMPCRRVNIDTERNFNGSNVVSENGKGEGKTVVSDKNLRHHGTDSIYDDSSVDYNCLRGDGQGNDHIQGEYEDRDGGRLVRRDNDGLKFIDAPTPTLIDEDDVYEDEEMVKLEYERIRRNATAPIGSHSRHIHSSQNDNSYFVCMDVNPNEEESVRRTPGAQMYRSNYENSNRNQTVGEDSQSHQERERSESIDKESIRRTPGACKMHSSALAVSPTADTRSSSAVITGTDTSGLGFSLTLSSPITNGEKYVSETKSLKRTKEKDTNSRRDVVSGGSNIVKRGSLNSPWSKVPQEKVQHHLGFEGRGVYSPNTLRLAEDMGNLLLEDDDHSDETQTFSQFVFRSNASATPDEKNQGGNIQLNRTTSVSESWTTPFIVNMDQSQHQPTSRVPRNAHGRGRKSRLDRIGRSRSGVDRAPSSSLSPFTASATTLNQQQQRSGGNSFLPRAHQPTPLRRTHPQSFGCNGDRNDNSVNTSFIAAAQDASFVNSISEQGSSFFDYPGQQHGHPDMNTPPVNFGGAFSPPAKVQQHHRPFPPSHISGSFLGPNNHGSSVFDDSLQFPSFPTGTPAFGGSFLNESHQHQVSTQPSYFQGSATFGHNSTFQTIAPHPGESVQHPPSSMFTKNVNHPRPHRHSPSFNFPLHPNTVYQINGTTHHASLAPDFVVNVNLPHGPNQQPPTQFLPNPQSWASNLPLQYEGMRPSSGLEQQYNSHAPSTYSNHGRWQIQQFRVRHLQPQLVREGQACPGMGNSSQSWNNQDGDKKMAHSDASQQDSGFHAPNLQHRQPFVSTPGPSTGRQPSRGKNQRKIKNFSRKWSNKNQQQKIENSLNNDQKGSQRVDLGPSGGGNTQGNLCSILNGKKPSTVKGGKKKQKDRSTPMLIERSISTPVQEISTDQTNNTISSTSVKENIEDVADAKRAELTESPATRSAFKDFYRKLRAEERNSFQGAEKFAMHSLKDGSLPESIHWRVYLELADLAKRSNRFEDARKLYQQVYKLQPYASQGWLEFSKLEEECGNMSACAKILAAGLKYCEYSENLLTRAIKHEEKRGNLSRAREFLSRLKHVGIDKVWRTVLEGAMLEARAGNDVMARRVLKYLMHHVPWYGPLYLEAYKLEKDLDHSREALAVVERGLAAIPRYGPLWFGAFRLCEELDLEDGAYRLPQSMAMIDRATSSISKELIWKVHLEAAQMLERSSTENLDSSTDPTFLQVMEMSRKRFALTIISCPPNLRWKVWLAAGRMEVAAGNADIARQLFLRAHRVVPDKGRAVALLECARLEEFVGDVELASAILCRSRNVGGSDWKVWLESVMLAIRSGNYTKAIALAQKALQQHSGTGRLWASLIQLRHLADVEEAQFKSLALALNAVPKSGEVWCEGARIHLNPFSRTFDLQRASRHLFFATKFTPQYGDGFLETLRLLILDQLLVPISTLIWERSGNQLQKNEDETWKERLTSYIFKVLLELCIIRESVTTETTNTRKSTPTMSLLGKSVFRVIIERLYSGTCVQFIDISRLELRCANADPNYGPLWFHCRSGPTETARNVLTRAVNLIIDEVKTHACLYIVAILRRLAVISHLEETKLRNLTEGTPVWEKVIDQELLSTPSLNSMIQRGSESLNIGVNPSERYIPSSNFIAGIAQMSQHHPIENLTLPDRRKVLFGADSLFS